MANAAKQFTVALTDDSIERLLRKNDEQFSRPSSLTSSNFSLRYSVPPDSLNSASSDLQLRKTSRGEFIVEENDNAAGSENPRRAGNATSSTSKLGKPTFRGPSNNSRETECVLIYNPASSQYELHFMDLEIQVTPALKARARNGTSVEPPSTQSSSATPSIFHNRKPTKTVTPENTLPHISSSSASATPAKGTVPVMHASSQPTTGARTATKRTKKLPTRKKVVSKVKKAARELAQPELLQSESLKSPSLRSEGKPEDLSKHEDLSVMATMKLPKNYGRIWDDAQVKKQESRVLTAPRETEKSTVIDLTAQDEEDEDFNELADELADDLMEASDEEEVPAPKVNSMGTAGGSAEDGDSSEEE